MQIILIVIVICGILILRFVGEGLALDLSQWAFTKPTDGKNYSFAQRIVQLMILLACCVLALWFGLVLWTQR